MKVLMARHLASAQDWAAALASLLVAGAALFYWFMPLSSTCTTTMATGASRCTMVSLALSQSGATIALTPLVAALGLGLGWVLFLLRHSRWVLAGFAVLSFAFFVLSFGLDGPLLPAAVVSLVAAILPGRPLAKSP